MREHGLQPKRRRRFVATTDSDHSPIFPDLARDRIIDGPNQLWVADITYIAIAMASSIWRQFLTPGHAV